MENQEFSVTNINDLWMKNIFENLEKAEEYERYAREGCESPLEFISLPLNNRDLIIKQTQYKYLRFLQTELQLCLTDCTPVLNEDDIKKHMKELNDIDNVIIKEHLFIKILTSASNDKVYEVKLTPFYYSTLKYLSQLRVNIIKTLSPLLFVKKPSQEW